MTKRTKQLSKANQNLERQIAERKIALEALQESEERFRTLFQFAPDAYYLHDLDGNILDGNLAARRLLGYEASDLAGKTYRDLAIFPEEQLAKVEALLNRNREGEATGPDELILTHKNGEHVVVEIRTHPVKLDDRLVVLGIARDITHRKRAEEALRESEERYALAARGASDGLWDWDLERDRIYYSPRWKEMLGFKDEEIGNAASDWFDRVHPDDLHSLRQAIQEHLRGESSHFENEHRLRDSRGRYRWMLSRGIAVLRSDGKPHRMAGSQTDVTERKAAEEQLQHDAFHDALTGLPNRALFMDRLERALRGTRRGRDTSLAVLFLDIDRFKVVNDSLGHLVGDQLLVAIARRLRGCVRPEDTVARLGGDEFTILISLIADLSDVTRVTDRIQTALRRPFDLDGQEVFVTASIGIALNSGGYDRASQLLRDADTAMYRAKTQGRDRHELFDHEMHAEAVALLKLETDLRRALQKREFRIHYQPIVEFESRRIRALEALLRWKHPERGYIDPAEFIKVAEETGLLLPLGNWVLEESCRQMKQWLADLDPSIARELSVNVNFSARQFQQSDLSERVRDALKQSGLPACHLRLEITEAALMDDAERNVEVIREIQHLGVRVLIDDFGTGYSSLSYLHRSHIEALKIDRSLVRNLTSGDENKEIVSAIATLGRSLGIDVIAEGVETPEQETSLREVHCRMGQGYLFFKPMDSDAVAQLLNDPRTKESFVRS